MLKQMRIQNKSMLDGPLLPAILAYSIPITLTNFLQLAFNSADMVIVGQFCGTNSFAAVSATAQIINLLLVMFNGLAIGVNVAVAHGLGSSDDADVHQTVHTAVPAALLSGVLLMLVGFLISNPFLHLLGTPEQIMPKAELYLKIFFAGVPFSMLYNYCAAILRAAGDTKSPLLFLGISGLINVGLNVLLVTVIRLDVAGVALATVISNFLSAVLALRTLMRRSDACAFCVRKMQIYPQQMSKILRIGLPAGVQGTMYGIANLFIQSSVNSFGEIFMSGSAAAANIELYVYNSVAGFSQAAVTFTGQNYGAKNYKRIWKTTMTCMLCAAVVGALFGQLAMLFRMPLLSLFVPDSPEAVGYGVMRLGIIATTYFLCTIVDVTTSTLRGMGQSLAPMLVSVLGICGVRVLWLTTVFQIPQYHTPENLFLCFPISWVITMTVQFMLFVVIYRKKVKITPLNL